MVFSTMVAKIVIDSVSFICDTPARAFLQSVKGHSGFFGCGYCRQRGEYVEDHVIFPDMDAQLRTD